MAATIIPVIMCGGAGTRLWPVSRGEHAETVRSPDRSGFNLPAGNGAYFRPGVIRSVMPSQSRRLSQRPQIKMVIATIALAAFLMTMAATAWLLFEQGSAIRAGADPGPGEQTNAIDLRNPTNS